MFQLFISVISGVSISPDIKANLKEKLLQLKFRFYFVAVVTLCIHKTLRYVSLFSHWIKDN